MKNYNSRLRYLLMILIVGFVLTGCGAQSTDSPQVPAVEETSSEETTAQVTATEETTAPKQEPALKVYVSIYPVYYLAQRIGGERLDLTLIIPPGTDAHDFEPKAKLVGEMTKADVIFYNGLGLEHWTESLFGQLPKSVTVIETSVGIETHTIDEVLKGDSHQHEHNHNHGAEGLDPHIWLDPTKAIQQAAHVLEALKAADSEGANVYTENFEALKADLEELDAKFQADLSAFKRREIVVGHAAFGYLVERYNLKQIAISGISPLEEPSAAALGELTHVVKDNKVTTIFYETLASPKFSEVLAAETGTKTAVLNPLEGLTQEEFDAGEDYISIMMKNLEAIKASLKDE